MGIKWFDKRTNVEISPYDQCLTCNCEYTSCPHLKPLFEKATKHIEELRGIKKWKALKN